MNSNQEASFKAFKTADPNLTEKDFLRMKIYYSVYWDTTIEKLQAKLTIGRLRIYREDTLKRENISQWNAGHCYHKGKEDWSRRDGLPLSKQDIIAIDALVYGQYTDTQNKVGDMVAHVTWECDSSD